MPLLHTPKPRQFHYQPRFYDPRKEEWEERKRRFAAKKSQEEVHENQQQKPQRYFKKPIKFSHRFDVEDPDSFKPAPAGKVFVYAAIVCLLILWIMS